MTETRSSLLQRLRNPADKESWDEFVALYEPVKRTAYEHLYESNVIGFDRIANIVARPLVWRDSSAEYCYPVARQQSRDETYAADVGITIRLREAQPATQVFAHLVAIEEFDPKPGRFESRRERPRKRGLACA